MCGILRLNEIAAVVVGVKENDKVTYVVHLLMFGFSEMTTLPIALQANVPITPHDSPLPGGYTPGSDEGRVKLQELMTMCIKLSTQVLDLEKEKDAQAVEILKLKKRVQRLERQRKSSTSQPRRRKYRQVESSDDDLNEEDASKQGRSSDKTNPMLLEKKYPLVKELLEKMPNLQLEAKEESIMAFELIKFIKSMLEE
ncbi:hypothetical protein Tco_0031817 [Tanacetum coccineum]